jgi:hypothetical protein
LTLRFTCVDVATHGNFPLRNAAFKDQALFAGVYTANLAPVEDFAMQWTNDGEKWRAWLVDYSAARASAIARLGDRYLLARPINRRPANDLGAGQPGFQKVRTTTHR